MSANNITVNVGNDSLGVYNIITNVGNDGACVCCITTDIRNVDMCADRQLSLGANA